MKVLLSVGCPHSGHDQVFALLGQAGVFSALPCRKANVSPQALQEQLLRTQEVKLHDKGQLEQVHPGKLWNELAADLFLTNIDHPLWGWADSQTAALMDFWLDFDPQVRVLLVYNSPEVYLELALQRNEQLSAQVVDMALENWLRWNTALSRYYHRHSDRCILVNSQQVIEKPAALIDALATHWEVNGLHLPEVSGGPSHNYRNLSVNLIRQMIDDRHPVWSLIQEMDGAALLPTASSLVTHAGTGSGAYPAWADWVKVRTALANCESAIASQTELATNYKQENGQLNLQLNNVKEALQHHFSIYQELEKRHRAIAEVSVDANELKQENELMLLQLHQVQEELEHYFLRCRQLEEQQNFWRIHPPEVLRVDMRQDVTGVNWYPAEVDGRWAGPTTYSTVQMPPLHAGEYMIELEVVDAMDADIVSNMQIEAFGQSLAVQFDGPLSENLYPVTGRTQTFIAEKTNSDPWLLGMRFTHLVSPADSGADDRRNLAIRLRTLRLIRST